MLGLPSTMALEGERVDTSDEETLSFPGARAKPGDEAAGPCEKLGVAPQSAAGGLWFEDARVDTSEEAAEPAPKRAKTKKKPAAANGARRTADVPDNGGALAFARWAGGKLSNEHMSNLANYATRELRVGSLCSGMGTEFLAMEALQQIAKVPYKMAFVCEKDPRKLQFLVERHPQALSFQDVTIFGQPLVKDTKGIVHDVPPCDILFGGFSCKDLSALTPNPKSVQAKGSTGVTLRGILD